LDWYRGSEVCTLVLRYYFLLRAVLQTKPFLRRCLTRCRHCRIFFLTHPRNAGRKDLRCPFGCREAHRRKESIGRSTEYYRGEQGRKYKRRQNQRQEEKRRSRSAAKDNPGGESAGDLAKPSPWPEVKDGSVGSLSPTPATGGQARFQAPPGHLIDYVRMVVSWIEARPVSRAEILEMLQRLFRQHTMSHRRQVDHTVAWLHENPP